MSPALEHATVILLHQLPDETSHFDWLIARDGPADAPLLTFRVGLRPDDPQITAFSAERLPDHRSLYLHFEGPLESKDGVERGSVTRLARGVVRIVRESDHSVEIQAEWEGGSWVYRGAVAEAGGWRFTVTPTDLDRR